MRIAFLADLHANREAGDACLATLARAGHDRLVLLGDLVGYGADPEWAVDTGARLVDDGAIAVLGNHDAAVVDPAGSAGGMRNPMAEAAIVWSHARLSDTQRRWLAALPLQAEDEDRLYVHANAWAPGDWGYVANALAASRSLAATAQRVTFCGHVHPPGLYHSMPDGPARAFTPVPGQAIPLLHSRRWLALPGSAGQPRDGNPAACCALYDTDTLAMTWLRVPYDHHAAAEKIRRAGLPEALAARLAEGC